MLPYVFLFFYFIILPFFKAQSACDNTNCTSCNSTAQPPVCLSCNPNSFLLNGACYGCDTSMYNCTLCNTQSLNATTYPYFSQCVNCSHCSTNCSNPGCLSCLSSQCFQCSPAYYLDSNYTCQPCSSSCQTCNGPNNTNCLSCQNGFFLANQSCFTCDLTCQTCNSSQCLTCNSGGVIGQDGKCHYQCDSTCGQCFGTQNNQCLSCNSNTTVLYQGQCIVSGCSQNCGNCVNVTGGSSVCLGCKTGFYLPPSCVSCSSSCKTCNGSTDNDCQSCFDGSYLNRKTNSCSACYYLCSQCYGPQLGSCFSCIDGYYIMESVCLICNETCLTCYGPHEDHCLTCDSTRVYNNDTKMCVGNGSNAVNTTTKSQSSSQDNQNALIISLSVIFGLLVVVIIVLTVCYIKAKKKVNELKYLNSEILSKKSSVKLDPNSEIPSVHNFMDVKKSDEGKTPVEHHELIQKDPNFDNILENNCKEIEKIYENE